jgi:bifunctional ADP-heptose synthase (sugar kinase/adenylyltransferase)
MPVGDESGIERAGARLREELGAEDLLVTRGADGMSLFEPGTELVHIPVVSKSEVFDITGAGDTVVAAFTFARLAGAGYPEAACLANVAGGLSVRRSGAAPVGAVELRAALDG